ncbi:30S ribosomal S17P [Fusarium agapanthi]|uniref:30S ribosomal S17P n=1 Tax=Fusarium agapanthi TaxID=1803897 RepID=A0A9P5BHU8_9HYPO|nr:30S ribosomal S17P [Fusarium agapanthi]
MSSKPLADSSLSGSHRAMEQYAASLRQVIRSRPEGDSERSCHLYELSCLLWQHYLSINGEGDPTEALSPGPAVASQVPLHFAGHARMDPEDPIGSYLCLDEERDKCLTVLDLLDIKLQSRSPFLAYLSVCDTGRIENNHLAVEGIHLINGFHTAGFRHVIGTLWEVKDEICVDMARITHEGMVQNGMTDETVSRGLHEASRELRDRWLTLAGTDHRTIRFSEVGTNESDRGDVEELEGTGLDGFLRDIVTCDEEPVYPPWIPYIHYGV